MPHASGTFEITGMNEDPWHQGDGEPRLTPETEPEDVPPQGQAEA